MPGEFHEPGKCPSRPQLECESPRSSRLIVKNNPDKGKNLLVWRWNSGRVTKDDIGDPTRTTKFALCVYDSLGGAPFRILSLEVDGGRSWRRTTPQVLQYSAFRETGEGVTGILLKTAASGGKIRFKAEGSRFPVPSTASKSKLFHKDKDLVVQLINSSTSHCWTSTFATAASNSTEAFAATESSRDRGAVTASRGGDEPCMPENSSGTVTR